GETAWGNNLHDRPNRAGAGAAVIDVGEALGDTSKQGVGLEWVQGGWLVGEAAAIQQLPWLELLHLEFAHAWRSLPAAGGAATRTDLPECPGRQAGLCLRAAAWLARPRWLFHYKRYVPGFGNRTNRFPTMLNGKSVPDRAPGSKFLTALVLI